MTGPTHFVKKQVQEIGEMRVFGTLVVYRGHEMGSILVGIKECKYMVGLKDLPLKMHDIWVGNSS